jgi:hypothetical protein
MDFARLVAVTHNTTFVAGRNRTITVHGSVSLATCPARALEDWLRLSNTSSGLVFQQAERLGHVRFTTLLSAEPGNSAAWHMSVAPDP